jgi:predicted Zn-dependent peptidase
MARNAERLDVGVYRTRLPEGPIVLSERIDAVRSVALGLWVRQGSAHEPPGQGGISHLLEHLVFKGTNHRSAHQLAREIEQVGGGVDAYTSHEVTAFQAHVPDDALEAAVDVLTDLTFQPALRAGDLALERGVILEELAGIEETPEELVFEEHAARLYGSHPYGAPVIGTRSSLESLGTALVRDYHSRAYRPANVVIAAAGRVDHEKLVGLIEASLPSTGGSRPTELSTPVASDAGITRVPHASARQTHLVAGGLTVPFRDPLRYAVVLVNTALGGGMSSRLFQSIREERGLAYSVYSFQSFYAAGGHAGAYVGTGPDTSEAALELLLGELKSLAEQGLSDREIEDTKTELKGRMMISLESPGARMNRLAGLTLYERPYRTLDEVCERIDRIRRDEVAKACALFHPDRLAVIEMSPVGADAVPVAEVGRDGRTRDAPIRTRS